LRKNTEEKKRKKHSGRRERKKGICTIGNCQGSIQQNYCMDGEKRNTNRDIGKG